MEQKINYEKLMYKEIEKISAQFEGLTRKPTLLLHSCCGPCSTACLEKLINHFDITVFFYNPNIDPQNELEMRIEAQKKVLEIPAFSSAKLIIAPNNRSDFISAIDLENFPQRKTEKECGSRCTECYRFRMQKTFDYAREHDFDFWTTTLTLGPQKDAQKINALGNLIQTDFARQVGAGFAKDTVAASTRSEHVAADFAQRNYAQDFRESQVAANNCSEHVAADHRSSLNAASSVCGPQFLHADFKKGGGFLRSLEICKEYGIYRQSFCGCVFGRAENEKI